MSADPELATRAPESDAMEDQSSANTQPTTTTSPDATTKPSDISATDSVAQSGPTMGHDCTSDRPAPINTGSTGTITQLGDIDTVSTPFSQCKPSRTDMKDLSVFIPFARKLSLNFFSSLNLIINDMLLHLV
jgi:hypothetical protein